MCHELGRKTIGENPFIERCTSEKVQMSGSFLKLEGHTYMFCSAVQFSFWTKTVPAPTKIVTFEDAEDNEQKSREEMFVYEKQCLIYVKAEFQLQNRP